MIKLSEKGRKALRMVYRGVGSAAAVSFLFSCDISVAMYGMPLPAYGMPPDNVREEVVFHGRVLNANQPLPGISVWINVSPNPYLGTTDSNGRFFFHLPRQDSYTIVFSDIDGAANGQFEPHTREMTWEEINALAGSSLDVDLVRINEE